MNANDLLDAMGEISGSFVANAQRCREEKTATRRPALWFLLVAAILTALLTGCAVAYALRLERMKVGTVEVQTGQSQPVTGNVLSLQVSKGSKGYNAAKEWLDYVKTFDRTVTGSRPLTEEEELQYYGLMCDSREMADKVDALCEKYGLHLHGEVFHEVPLEDMCRLLGIPGILREDAGFSAGGRFFQDGNFYLEGSFTGPDAKDYLFSFSYNPADSFDDVYMYMGDISDYREWTYTTASGTELLLTLGPQSAVLAADREDAFLCVTVQSIAGDFDMDEARLEVVAEMFDFTIQTKPLDGDALETARQIQQNIVDLRLAADPMRVESYQEYAKNWIAARERGYQIHGQKPLECSYIIRDMNGDGVEELVLFCGELPNQFVTIRDGRTDEFGNAEPKIWCENNIFIEEYEFPPEYTGGQDKGVLIYQYNGTAKMKLKGFYHYEEGWRERNVETDAISDTVLTDEEFQAILDACNPIDLTALDIRPLRDLAESK